MSSPVEDTAMEARRRFGLVVRTARLERGWRQDELAAHAGVSEPTIQRWETGKTGTPEPDKARAVFQALGLDPRRIPVLLGYITAEEMDLPPEAPRVFNPTTEEVISLLESPDVPPSLKAEVLRYLQFRAQEEGRENGAGEARMAG